MSCTCQKCGKQYTIDILIPDELWKQITPNRTHLEAGLLCGSCIMKALESVLGYDYFFLSRETLSNKMIGYG